jgi:hypothetical protein
MREAEEREPDPEDEAEERAIRRRPPRIAPAAGVISKGRRRR